MAERALPQASRKNVLRVFRDLLRPAEAESYSNRALEQAGYGQARHVHALLTFLGFLDGDQPNHDVRQRRKDLKDFAGWLRRAVCDRYEARLGDVGFLFDEPNRETARSLAKKRVAAASEKSERPLMERNMSQVVDCLLAMRDVHRHLQADDRDWLDPPPEPKAKDVAGGTAASSSPAESDAEGSGRSPTRNSGDNGMPDSSTDNGASGANPSGAAIPPTAGDFVTRLAGRLADTSRRLTFHAKHVEINDGQQTTFQLADVAITIE